MKKLFLCVLAILAVAASAGAQTIYTVGDTGQFGSFNLTNFVYTQINANSLNGYVTLTPNGAGGFYSTTASLTAGANSISRVSTAGVLSSTAGPGLDYMYGMGRSPTGILYGQSYNSGNLVRVDPTTGKQTTIGSVGTNFNPNQGNLTFVGSTLYAYEADNSTGNAGLYTVNTTTGALTQIGALNDEYGFVSGFSVGTTLYAVDASNASVYRINTTTAAMTLVGTLTGANLPAQFVGAATVVPEPSTWFMLAVGTGLFGLAVLRRRRAA